jgi:uncharacterized protein YeaO (DUF488 family)
MQRRSSRSSVQIRRAYSPPHAEDGYRVLVDRLWPRGRTKASVRLDAWAKDLGPSTRLRTWFGHDPARWETFKRRYRAELAAPERAVLLDDLVVRAGNGTVTLIYAARDEHHNEAMVIAEKLKRRLAARRRSRARTRAWRSPRPPTTRSLHGRSIRGPSCGLTSHRESARHAARRLTTRGPDAARPATGSGRRGRLR